MFLYICAICCVLLEVKPPADCGMSATQPPARCEPRAGGNSVSPLPLSDKPAIFRGKRTKRKCVWKVCTCCVSHQTFCVHVLALTKKTAKRAHTRFWARRKYGALHRMHGGARPIRKRVRMHLRAHLKCVCRANVRERCRERQTNRS